MATHDGADRSINGWNGPYLEAMYEQWQSDPDSVDPQLRQFFQGFDLGFRPPGEGGAGSGHALQGKVDSLIYHYRDIGHYAAALDPLGSKRPRPADLELGAFGLSDAQLGEGFDPSHLPLENPTPLREIISVLEDTYCRHIGVEYMHIQDRERRRWLQDRMESVRNRPTFTREGKLRVLTELIEADGFESFLHTRYRGKKRFGLDGGESLIPMLDELAQSGPEHGVQEYTFGMAHRGRLNVLVNILHKSFDQIFTEFDEAWTEDFLDGGGDVKYHRGYSGDFKTEGGDNIRMTLSPNPSHLEFVNAVVLGRARAKQRLRDDEGRARCIPVLIHGDASFPGQGVVSECLNMMKLDGYTVGGAIHIIVNNQIGFTTNPSDAHSGHYCTDLAKMVEAPIFHVNGDDPEACVFAARLALAYRQAFKNDVVIDMWCYRRHGHNEGDEPAFTQPLMYEKIKAQPSTLRQYADRLISEGVITSDEFDQMTAAFKTKMDEAQTRTKSNPVEPSVKAFQSAWGGLTDKYSDDPVETGVDRALLETVAAGLGTVPENFTPHKKLAKLLQGRRAMVEDDQSIDWAMGELLAYGTLLLEGHPVRLTGQDVERGTFSHRHAVLVDQKSGEQYAPLKNLAEGQARFCIHNSPLTESACVGFEYGYSLGDPNMLIIWEAQFGDFANGAQVYFDQFIASAEVKWQRFSGLTCFLPHGYEGQGPEHSSARLERFLTLCAKDDMQVAYPSSPAQMFHVLRRQMKRGFRKPLILMTPKSLLRHPKAVSPVSQLVNDRFHHVLDDPSVADPKKIRRVVWCTGKVYYDLLAERETAGRDDVALVRVEQLFPFREASVRAVLDRYPGAEMIWAQEEPSNMGAWRHIDAMFRDHIGITLAYVGREANASPAVASTKIHTREQQALLARAIDIDTNGSALITAATAARAVSA